MRISDLRGGTPLTGLQDLWDAEPGPALVGLAPTQAITLRAFSPRRLAKGLQEPKGRKGRERGGRGGPPFAELRRGGPAFAGATAGQTRPTRNSFEDVD
ncbi:hypothetical protein SBV1_3110009 [Verrucomicrobia bacterium]|nr:hypothetical protein SBV1_3110009 [Verrucomicrobiota bacterium]